MLGELLLLVSEPLAHPAPGEIGDTIDPLDGKEFELLESGA